MNSHDRGTIDDRPRSGLDHRADHFPQVRIGQADHRHVLHPRVGGDEVFHVAGGDVLAPADDDVLEAPGDADDTALVDHGQVAGAEVAVGGEGLLVCGRVVEVAREDARAAGGELTLHPGAGLGSGGVEGHKFVVGAYRPADGVADDLLGVVRPRLRTRAFDHAERVGVAHAQPLSTARTRSGRAVRRAHVHLPERGEVVVGEAVEGGDAAHQRGHQAGGGARPRPAPPGRNPAGRVESNTTMPAPWNTAAVTHTSRARLWPTVVPTRTRSVTLRSHAFDLYSMLQM